MSERTLRTILGALGVLVVVWIVSTLISDRLSRGSGPDGGIAALLGGLDETSVSTVSIVGPDQTVSLQRTGGVWTVNGNPADSTVVTRLWSALAEAEVGRIVASNPANHGRMGLSTDSAWAVEFALADGGTAAVLVGKVGPVFPSGYVRLPDQDAVVVVSGDFRSTVTLSVTEWRDKTILRVDTAAVVRVVLETDEGTHVAERSDSTWSIDGEPANANAMRTMLDELANFVAVGFVEDGSIYQENPRRVTVLGAERDTLGSVVITGDTGNRHARAHDGDVVFEVAGFRANRIVPDIATLLQADAGGA